MQIGDSNPHLDGAPLDPPEFPSLTHLGELAGGVGDEHAGLSHGAVADDDALDGVGVLVHFATVSPAPAHSITISSLPAPLSAAQDIALPLLLLAPLCSQDCLADRQMLSLYS